MKEQNRKEFDDLYDAYVKALKEAYESEGHFYANKPKSKELKAIADLAYKKFDKFRKKQSKEEEG